MTVDKNKLKEILKELNKIRLLEKIKKTQDIGAIVDILQSIIGKINLAKGEKGETPTKEELLALIKPLIPAPIKGDKGESIQGRPGKDAKPIDETKIIKEVLKKIPVPKDGIDGKDADEKKITADILKKVSDEIETALENLKEDKELEIDDVKNLKKTLKGLEKKISDGRTYFGGGGGVGKHNVVAYDLSSSLSADGSVRTFSLPAFWKVISIHLSSFPNILRPTVDYTVDTPNSQITFTSEIPAASISSATSQTCIILYSE